MTPEIRMFPTRSDEDEVADDGVVRREDRYAGGIETLRYELSHSCAKGSTRMDSSAVESYIGNVSSASQPAGWISGFFGVKSHLEKSCGICGWIPSFRTRARQRGPGHLPAEVKELLKELTTLGTRFGGLHAAAGALRPGGGLNVRLAVLASCSSRRGYRNRLPQAQFCLWLKKEKIFDK